ncbi:glycosyltransferase family 39 protein [Candidatus Daviesbacteria bacterium]|nr:glycosyltransferase family 39 protein [Candidatus Daviesbacteria bacterium]
MIWAVLGLGLVLRLISLNQSLWLDEAINVMAARSFSLWGMVTQYAVADFHPPGWFIILWVWGKTFGYSEIAVRIPSVIIGVLTIYITYLLGKKLISKNVGLIAALLLAINPLHIYYSQEARMYALAALAVSLNMLLFIDFVRGGKGGKGSMVIYVLSNIFILLSDYVAYLIFPVQFVFLLFLRKEALRGWSIRLVAACLAFIWWLPVFLKQLDVGSTASANLPTWKFVVGGFDFKTIPLTFVKFIIGRISLVNKIMYAALLLPIVTLFTFLLWHGIKNLTDTSRKLLFFWLIIPSVIATMISFFIPVYSYFRVLFIIPVFVLLVSNGISEFRWRLRYVFLVVIIFIQLFCAFVYLLNTNYQRDNWRGLVSYFKNIQPEVILFESSGTLPPFDYYAGGSLNVRGALNDFPARDDTAIAGLSELLKDKREIYLVDYLVQISDPDRLVAKKLTELGYTEKEIKDFHGVGFVYHYVKND